MTDEQTPDSQKLKIELELSAIDRTITILGTGTDFLARQTCRVDEASVIGEFLRYLRDLKRDLKERTRILKNLPTEEPKPEPKPEPLPADVEIAKTEPVIDAVSK